MTISIGLRRKFRGGGHVRVDVFVADTAGREHLPIHEVTRGNAGSLILEVGEFDGLVRQLAATRGVHLDVYDHDEPSHSCVATPAPADVDPLDAGAAVHAVRELHRPVDRDGDRVCASVDHGDIGWQGFPGAAWPCPTMRALGALDDGSWPALAGERDIHSYFELSYANYLVLHRSVLQSMPEAWQIRFVALLEEADRTVEAHGIEDAPQYIVQPADAGGDEIHDPIPYYNRGRTRLFDSQPDEVDA